MVVLGSSELSTLFPLKKYLELRRENSFLRYVGCAETKTLLNTTIIMNKHFVISSTVQRCCLSLL